MSKLFKTILLVTILIASVYCEDKSFTENEAT
jgi:hypothetical protein